MILATPGPTSVPEFIRVAMATPSIHHRTKEFETIFKKVRDNLKSLFSLEEVILLSSSGSGAMESSAAHFCQTKAIVIISGKFGERFSDILKKQNKSLIELKYPWDTPADITEIKNILTRDKKIDSIFIQSCESSGGLKHPVAEIAKLAKEINPNITIIVDGITSVGVESIDDSNIDVLISGSQKAFMLPPGLSMIWLSKYAIKSLKKPCNSLYFDLELELKNQQKNTTAFTPAIPLIIGLNAILDVYLKNGIDELYKTTSNRARAMREALKSMDLKIYPKIPASSMSVVFHPQAKEIKNHLKEKFDILIAGGQDSIKDTIFRINNMGLIEPSECLFILNAIEITLHDFALRAFDGIASKKFTEVMYDIRT